MVDLRRALQEAEVDESLSEVVATMRVLKSANGDEGNSLGPTLSACVEFEGIPVKALLDTRSPVTIVSMRFHRVNAIPAGQAEAEGTGPYGVGSSCPFTFRTPLSDAS